MAEEKKRFPWWLVVCAAVLLLLGAVVGFIETVGRQGTIVGRYDRLTKGMSYADIISVLGRDPDEEFLDAAELEQHGNACPYSWREGPAELWIVVEARLIFMRDPTDPRSVIWTVERQNLLRKSLYLDCNHLTWWHVRRWAEQAYTAIHGPRR